MPEWTGDAMPPHERVRAARLARGLSLRAVARRLEVSAATLSAIENGRTGLSVARLTALAAELDVPAHELLGEEPGRTARGSTTAPTDAAHSAADDWRRFGPLETDPVLRAAIDSFVEIGYHGTTVRALARRAGTSVPGLYHHYRDKQELLGRILDLTMADLHRRVRAARAEGHDPVERVRLVVEALALFHTHRRDLGFIGASEMRSLLPAERARIAESRTAIQEILDEEIAAAAAEGVVTTPHTRSAGRAIATMCTGISQWYRPDGPESAEQIAARYGRFALDMLGAGHAADGTDPRRRHTAPPTPADI